MSQYDEYLRDGKYTVLFSDHTCSYGMNLKHCQYIFVSSSFVCSVSVETLLQSLARVGRRNLTGEGTTYMSKLGMFRIAMSFNQNRKPLNLFVVAANAESIEADLFMIRNVFLSIYSYNSKGEFIGTESCAHMFDLFYRCIKEFMDLDSDDLPSGITNFYDLFMHVLTCFSKSDEALNAYTYASWLMAENNDFKANTIINTTVERISNRYVKEGKNEILERDIRKDRLSKKAAAKTIRKKKI